MIKRPWAFWRRVQYGAGFTAFWALIGTAVFFLYVYTPINCFDKERNGTERGVDCGGVCVRICVADVTLPQVVWAKSFKVINGQYNAVAYLENRNEIAANPFLEYTFRLFDGTDVIAERSGQTILPPGSTYPVFEGRIATKGGRVPTNTTLEIRPSDMWVPATVGRDQFRTTNISLTGADSLPRLSAFVENTELGDALKVEVVATVFNQLGEAVTASQTFVDRLVGRSTQEIVFTWPEPIAKTIRSCEVPSDIMIVLDRSGSMAADGGTPPEPLESAKKAAQSFVALLRPNDQFGLLTYATTPSNPVEQTLTSNAAAMQSALAGVVMGIDGTQYTNMGDAFKSALTELTGSRHRNDARKVIIFLTDGDVTRPVNPETNRADREYAATYAKKFAEEAKAENVTIYSIGFGDFLTAANDAVARDVDLIRSLASEPDMYFEAPTVSDLEQVYKAIATSICEVGPARFDVIPKTSTNFTPLQ